MNALHEAVADMPAVDQHAHVLAAEGCEPPLARVLTESDDPAQIDQVTSHPSYHRAVAELVAVGAADRRRLLAACRFSAVLVDDGFRFPGAGEVAGLAALLDCPVHRIVRIESLVESAAQAAGTTLAETVEAFRATLLESLDEGAVALKSIAAYRGGLDLPAVDADTAAAAHLSWRASGRGRLSDPLLVSFFLDQALDAVRRRPVPLQVHTGMGDADLRLERADPLLLRPLIERAGPQVPVVLLHCYPFVAHASYLAGMFSNVYLDLSLAMTLVSHLGPHLVLEALGQAPATKLLFATDASRRAESFYLASRWWRDGLARALSVLVERGHLSAGTALKWAQLVLAGNARRVYHLD